MINARTIEFGKGTVGVGSIPSQSTILFYQLESPQKVGDHVTEDAEYTGSRAYIKLDAESYNQFCKLLDLVENNVQERKQPFEFKSYWFDFSQYDPKSIKVCRQQATRAISGYLRMLAC